MSTEPGKCHFYATVGNSIRLHRQRSDMTIDGLAKAANISRYTLNTAESGQSVSAFVLTKLAHALDVTVDDLIPLEALEVKL